MDNQERKKHQYRSHGGQQDHLRLQPVKRNEDEKSEPGSWKDKWEDTKVIMKSEYATLTDEDLNYKKGREEEDVYTRVGNRLGKNRQETEQMFNDIYDGRLERTKKLKI